MKHNKKHKLNSNNNYLLNKMRKKQNKDNNKLITIESSEIVQLIDTLDNFSTHLKYLINTQHLLTKRKLTAYIEIYGTDDEIILPDEPGHTILYREDALSEDKTTSFMYAELRFGGEIRIEVHITATLQSNEDIIITGVVQLFEGDEETTNDLDGETSFSVLIPKDTDAQTYNVAVKNTDEGGDHAEVILTFSNKAV
ncbi:hypothetical protein SPE26_29645 [Bacillus thuringiensis]|uniref:Uncharacterized protein n=1 Tax=Bacillus thuringiensis TaxID=1428 RepID=A0AAW9GR68_BACTU|nr:hypothetical protein [Bacillus thuringiensis]MDY0854900.1 hypothetical protein [Bacillus thuringiensis]MDY4394816.1 hypothetical protein [Bacillus thuringiensis]